ncbi:MAG: sugar phosphate isomerase/epimerase [Phycisphaerae bacterium]|nr:sugar phosphate isomerase/epimerase [Phycisphaerae bacterium]
MALSLVLSVLISMFAATPPIGSPGGGPITYVKPTRDDSASESLGFRLGVQAWTFRDRTCFEAIDTARKLGLKYIEIFPGQSLSPEHPGAKVGHDMSREHREALKLKLLSSGVRAVSYGVVSPTKDEKATRAIFQFAKDMGLETITVEPEPDAWDLVAKLADEFSINAACHNHPKPSRYWDPQTVLDAVKGRSPRVGACADTGHWPRSGLVPVDCLKKYEGRIITLHFKDITDGEDRPWGTGKGDAKGILTELKRQGFKGVISVEYESGAGPELEANVKKCIEFFDATAAELAARPR